MYFFYKGTQNWSWYLSCVLGSRDGIHVTFISWICYWFVARAHCWCMFSFCIIDAYIEESQVLIVSFVSLQYLGSKAPLRSRSGSPAVIHGRGYPAVSTYHCFLMLLQNSGSSSVFDVSPEWHSTTPVPPPTIWYTTRVLSSFCTCRSLGRHWTSSSYQKSQASSIPHLWMSFCHSKNHKALLFLPSLCLAFQTLVSMRSWRRCGFVFSDAVQSACLLQIYDLMTQLLKHSTPPVGMDITSICSNLRKGPRYSLVSETWGIAPSSWISGTRLFMWQG